MEVELECMYCGHKWTNIVRNQAQIEAMVCEKRGCGHSTLKVRDMAKKIDYYQGSPPFEEKVELELSKYFGNIYGRSD